MYKRQVVTFDLRGDLVTQTFANGMMSTFSKSYLSMMGPDPEAIEKNNLMVTGTLPCKDASGTPTLQCLLPEDAVDSDAIRHVNPTKLYPTVDTNTRAFASSPHSATTSNYNGAGELSPTEFYKLILAADMGGNFYSRENSCLPSVSTTPSAACAMTAY